jgi:hypothetical protein
MSPASLLVHALSQVALGGQAQCGNGTLCDINLPVVAAGKSELQEVLQIVFAILGALAVLMIVIAGLRFITAQGNPQETGKARSTIVYSVVGLIIALTAEAIVTFVLDKLQ